MKATCILFGTVLLLTGSVAGQNAPDADGSSMKAEDIAKQWQKQPAQVSPPGVRTRGLTRGGPAPAKPALRTRGAGLSQQAAEANESTLRTLKTRGIKVLHGQEAADAQAGVAVTPAASPSAAAPAFVEIPIVPEKRIAFRLRFKKDSTELSDQASQDMVSVIAQAMKAMPQSFFMLEGHTCDLGNHDHNQTLSEERALRIRTLLGDFGIDSNRLLAVGFGETQSELANTSEANRALNRRVIIGPIELPKEH